MMFCFAVGFGVEMFCLFQDQINMAEVKYPLQHFKVCMGSVL